MAAFHRYTLGSKRGSLGAWATEASVRCLLHKYPMNHGIEHIRDNQFTVSRSLTGRRFKISPGGYVDETISFYTSLADFIETCTGEVHVFMGDDVFDPLIFTFSSDVDAVRFKVAFC